MTKNEKCKQVYPLTLRLPNLKDMSHLKLVGLRFTLMSLQHNIHLGLLHHKSKGAYSILLPLSLKKRAVIVRMMQMLAVTIILLKVVVMMITLLTM